MIDPFFQSQEWLDLRYRALKRSNGCCQLCGSSGSQENPLQCDHIEPRSKKPKLALVESNIQVLCRFCNVGKSNKDNTDWRFKASPHLVDKINRRVNILKTADPFAKAKLEQLGWLRQNDVSEAVRAEAEKQYNEIWASLERAYDAREAK